LDKLKKEIIEILKQITQAKNRLQEVLNEIEKYPEI